MNHNRSELDQKSIELFAYKLWEERGRPAGSPEDDWFRAEHELGRSEPEPIGLPISPVVKGRQRAMKK
jgi:hypothetical protein